MKKIGCYATRTIFFYEKNWMLPAPFSHLEKLDATRAIFSMKKIGCYATRTIFFYEKNWMLPAPFFFYEKN
jgi:CMP-2-keto-3-deoxyoctulosonic acid synthetase